MSRSKNDLSFDDVYVDLEKPSHALNSQNPLICETLSKVLEKSIIQPGFETLERIPGCSASIKLEKLRKKKEKSKSKGPNWFDMKTPSITPEIQNDLRLIHMRSVLNPKHFYKKNDTKGLPKYFQVGKYVDSPVDFYSSRLTKKDRKKTLVEELMTDAEFQQYNKRKHKELIKKHKAHAKAHRNAKRLKKGKKR